MNRKLVIEIQCEDLVCDWCEGVSGSGDLCNYFQQYLYEDEETGETLRCQLCLDAEVKQ